MTVWRSLPGRKLTPGMVLRFGGTTATLARVDADGMAYLARHNGLPTAPDARPSFRVDARQPYRVLHSAGRPIVCEATP